MHKNTYTMNQISKEIVKVKEHYLECISNIGISFLQTDFKKKETLFQYKVKLD